MKVWLIGLTKTSKSVKCTMIIDGRSLHVSSVVARRRIAEGSGSRNVQGSFVREQYSLWYYICTQLLVLSYYEPSANVVGVLAAIPRS
jgi:hypothetical protein